MLKVGRVARVKMITEVKMKREESRAIILAARQVWGLSNRSHNIRWYFPHRPVKSSSSSCLSESQDSLNSTTSWISKYFFIQQVSKYKLEMPQNFSS